MQYQVNHFHKFFFHLIRTAKNMRIILGKSTNTGKAVKFPTLFIAINGTKLRISDRQLFVGMGFYFIDLAMVRTIHWLEQKFLALVPGMDGLKGVLAIFLIVSRRNIQLLASNMRRNHRVVACFDLGSAHELFQTLAKDG